MLFVQEKALNYPKKQLYNFFHFANQCSHHATSTKFCVCGRKTC